MINELYRKSNAPSKILGCSRSGLAIVLSFSGILLMSVISNYILHSQYSDMKMEMESYSNNIKRAEVNTESLSAIVKANSDQFSRMSNMGYVGFSNNSDIREIKSKLVKIDQTIREIREDNARSYSYKDKSLLSIERDMSDINRIVDGEISDTRKN